MSLATLYVTTPDKATATAIARELLQRKIVACANIFDPVSSMYWWEGKIEEASETVMLCKTRMRDVPRAIKAVKELHPYDVPCVTATPILKANLDYIKWVESICAEGEES